MWIDCPIMSSTYRQILPYWSLFSLGMFYTRKTTSDLLRGRLGGEFLFGIGMPVRIGESRVLFRSISLCERGKTCDSRHFKFYLGSRLSRIEVKDKVERKS